MKRRFSTELKVGLFFIVMLLMIAFISLRLGNINLFEERGYVVWAVFDTAAGVNPETEVLYAGIRIGRVDAIKLHEGKARIEMLVLPGVKLERDCSIALMSKGFLGARYMEISPGTVGAEPLKDGDQIKRVTAPFDISSVGGELNVVVDDIQAITANLRDVLGDEQGLVALEQILENVRGVTEQANQMATDNQRELHRILSNLAVITESLARVSSANDDAMSAALGDLPEITENLRVITENLSRIVQNNSDGMDSAMSRIADSSEQLRGTLSNLNEITAKINAGEGTLGKLVNDEETISKLNETLDGVKELVSTARNTRTEVGYRADYYADPEDWRHSIDLRISPRPDKYVQIGVVSSEMGSTKRTDTRTETTTNPGEDDEKKVVEEEIKTVTSDQYRFTALYARRFHDLVVRGGLIESEGGVGLDYYFFQDHLLLSAEAFDFDADRDPRLRAVLNLRLLEHIYLGGGVDDYTDNFEDPLWFVGAGLMIRDDDLSWLLTRIPTPGF
ncbi:MAG: MlaD family protein [Candidatus Alcyoniella australis]|nr:MlaD family protein [Candidatus Alcyoniella australis]